MNTFLHEYGHALDWQSGTTKYDFVAISGVKGLPGSEEMSELMDTIKKHPHFTESMTYMKKFGNNTVRYLRSREEVWARTYAQYMAVKMGGDVRAELENSFTSPGSTMLQQNFPMDVFESDIMDKVENVLNGMGLL